MYMAIFPEIQEKAFREIKEKIGDRFPQASVIDRGNFLMELRPSRRDKEVVGWPGHPLLEAPPPPHPEHVDHLVLVKVSVVVKVVLGEVRLGVLVVLGVQVCVSVGGEELHPIGELIPAELTFFSLSGV